MVFVCVCVGREGGEKNKIKRGRARVKELKKDKPIPGERWTMLLRAAHTVTSVFALQRRDPPAPLTMKSMQSDLFKKKKTPGYSISDVNLTFNTPAGAARQQRGPRSRKSLSGSSDAAKRSIDRSANQSADGAGRIG